MRRLIDANALLAELDKFINPVPNKDGLYFLSGLTTAITEIEDAPTVDAVEVVHGRWEYKQNKEHSWCTDIVCTACNTVIDSHVDNRLEYRQEVIKKKLLYCPNCGAKMDGDGNVNV